MNTLAILVRTVADLHMKLMTGRITEWNGLAVMADLDVRIWK